MTTPTMNPVQAQIASDPRLQAIANPGFQRFMALELMGGSTWEQGIQNFQSMMGDTKAAATEFAEQTKKQRETVEVEFKKDLLDIIMVKADDASKILAPRGGITIRVDFDSELKNADGSPQMDAANNPVRGKVIDFTFHWDKKSQGGTVSTNSTRAAGAGRKEGDYVFGADTYRNMSDYATKVYGDEFKNKGTKTTRAFLEDKGYVIPDEPVKGEDDKPHFLVEMPKAPATA